MNKARVLRRLIAVIPAVAVQAGLYWAVTMLLTPYVGLLDVILTIMAVIFVLHIMSGRIEGTYKVLWLLLIVGLPVTGTILYLLFGDGRTGKPLKKALEGVQGLPKRPENAEIRAELAETDGRMAQTFRYVQNLTGFPVYPNEEAVYYPIGEALFPAMLEALEQAERFIFMEYFIIAGGEMWGALEDVLARKAAQGVDVRVMYDDVGSISTFSADDIERLRSKGIRCIAFNPLKKIKGTVNYRDHRKMTVIDGKIAFSGGVNLADEYINREVRFGHWKDVGFRLRGAAVRNYTWMFAEFWNAFSGNPIPDHLLTEDVPPMPAIRSDGYVLSYYDSPVHGRSVSNDLYIELLSRAEKYAWFFTPYLLPGDALQDALIRAAKRGVDVRIIMPGIPDKKLVYRMGRSYYAVLLEAGVRIFEYTPGFVHAKGCISDDVVGTVGTVNLDYRSLFLHFENNSLFFGASILRDVKADFIATQEKCAERTLENIGGGYWKWLTDGVLRVFTPLC